MSCNFEPWTPKYYLKSAAHGLSLVFMGLPLSLLTIILFLFANPKNIIWNLDWLCKVLIYLLFAWTLPHIYNGLSLNLLQKFEFELSSKMPVEIVIFCYTYFFWKLLILKKHHVWKKNSYTRENVSWHQALLKVCAESQKPGCALPSLRVSVLVLPLWWQLFLDINSVELFLRK